MVGLHRNLQEAVDKWGILGLRYGGFAMRFGIRFGWMAVTVLVSSVAMAGAQNSPLIPKEIKVPIMTSAGLDAGSVTFKTVKKGVKVEIQLKNIPFGMHGVHIHQNPVCTAPDFKSAGGHFNPDGKMHGYSNPAGHHNGDLPSSISVGEDHKGSATFVLTSISLDPSAANSLFLNGGTSIVVHEKADDEMTDPSGASGNRIACGVIKQ
jgi:Cu-Zn family superoxide dismutase